VRLLTAELFHWAANPNFIFASHRWRLPPFHPPSQRSVPCLPAAVSRLAIFMLWLLALRPNDEEDDCCQHNTKTRPQKQAIRSNSHDDALCNPSIGLARRKRCLHDRPNETHGTFAMMVVIRIFRKRGSTESRVAAVAGCGWWCCPRLAGPQLRSPTLISHIFFHCLNITACTHSTLANVRRRDRKAHAIRHPMC